jgi:PadR family transcriptional regulator PadR
MLTVRLEEHNCRLRKYYRITEEGRKRLNEFENDWEQLLRIHAFITRKEKTDDEN